MQQSPDAHVYRRYRMHPGLATLLRDSQPAASPARLQLVIGSTLLDPNANCKHAIAQADSHIKRESGDGSRQGEL